MKLSNLIYQSIVWRGLYFVSVLVLNIMIARYYEASYSGLIYFVTNSFALIVIVSSLSLESGMGYYTVSDKIPLLSVAYFAFIWAIGATILIYVLIKVLVAYKLISSIYTNYTVQTFFYISGCMLVNFFTALFYAKKNFLSPNLIMLLVNTLLIIIIPFSNNTIFTKEQYLNIYFLGFLLQGVVMALYFVITHYSQQQFKLPSLASLKLIFRYALIAFWANIIFFLLYRMDYWFIQRFCSEKDLGNYIQVSKLVQMFMILPMILASSIFPQSASGNKQAVQKQVTMLSRFMMLLYLFLCGIVAIIGSWIFPALYGKTFDNMFMPFLLLIPGIFSLSAINLLSAFFAGQNKIWINVFGSFVGLVCIFLGNILLVPNYGIVAAAFTSSIGYTATLIVLFYYFSKGTEEKLSFIDFLVIKRSDFQFIKSKFLERGSL